MSSRGKRQLIVATIIACGMQVPAGPLTCARAVEKSPSSRCRCDCGNECRCCCRKKAPRSREAPEPSTPTDCSCGQDKAPPAVPPPVVFERTPVVGTSLATRPLIGEVVEVAAAAIRPNAHAPPGALAILATIIIQI